tara:strand:- start:707 stop:1579 length:873 start_codon:yes stop_codon:yes gene_type:complete
MAVKFIAKDDTLEDFRLAFNDQSANSFGDIANLSGSISSTNLVDAMNETINIATNTAGFILRDSTSTTQQIGGGNTLNVVGVTSEITAVVSATDTLTIGLPDDVTITGNLTASGTGTHSLGTIQVSGNTLSSSNATTITVNDILRANTIESQTGLVSIIETGGFPEIQSNRGDKVLLFDAIPLFNERIAFEGTTGNDFETVLNVTDPTADRIITLGDESGTVITTGSVGAITGTMITTGSLVTGNYANDSITLDKMADDSVGQAQLKDVVDLQIQNSSGGILKQIFGAGS